MSLCAIFFSIIGYFEVHWCVTGRICAPGRGLLSVLFIWARQGMDAVLGVEERDRRK